MTRIHQYVADAFVAEGVDTVFGLMGDGNMAWLAEMAGRPGVRVVHARHEAAALAMADGWAQAAGEVGVCSVTCGPGVTNLVTPLRVAAHNRTPVVVLAGDTPVGTAVHYQSFDIGSLRALADVDVVAVRSHGDLTAKLRAAFGTARRSRRPVVLALPYDLADERCDLPVYVPPVRPAGPAPARARDVEAVRSRLAAAGRVLLLLGRGAVAGGALGSAERLADHLGALTGTTVKALGALHHRAGDLGVVGGFSSPEARERIAGCDVVLALGAALSWHTTLGGALLAPERTVQVVDREDPWDPDDVFDPGLKVVADCRLFLEQLLEVLVPADAAVTPGARRPAPAALPRSPDLGDIEPADGLDPVAALATVRRALTDPVQLVVGAGHFWNHVVEMPEPPAPHRLQVHNGFGAIAQAFPAALGAALAEPDVPTVVLEGDGSLMMNLQELETAARSAIPLLVVVIDDGAYGAEYHKLVASGMRAAESVFGFADLAGVARALGLRATTPSSLDELAAAVATFLDDPAPTLVDVRVTRRARAGRYRSTYPVDASQNRSPSSARH
ncbi:thiamine pyrophosphate-binding protein [Jiangella endophytica]|uniref:thiamine pyrophosphate-binding protein n=1 Tax=Jiangella endophytica TaxID=1623398 RepID=UPI0018E4F63F|nr:thiamine pyrophosphate-binding protein [Jiangella endophytica]